MIFNTVLVDRDCIFVAWYIFITAFAAILNKFLVAEKMLKDVFEKYNFTRKLRCELAEAIASKQAETSTTSRIWEELSDDSAAAT
jgi:hypothetical protein